MTLKASIDFFFVFSLLYYSIAIISTFLKLSFMFIISFSIGLMCTILMIYYINKKEKIDKNKETNNNAMF